VCPDCGAENSHRDIYPEQYDHPLVGRTVRAMWNGKVVHEGVVERVMPSRFGQMAAFGNLHNLCYLVTNLEEVTA